jgi:hypothetical protein
MEGARICRYELETHPQIVNQATPKGEQGRSEERRAGMKGRLFRLSLAIANLGILVAVSGAGFKWGS